MCCEKISGQLIFILVLIFFVCYTEKKHYSPEGHMGLSMSDYLFSIYLARVFGKKSSGGEEYEYI